MAPERFSISYDAVLAAEERKKRERDAREAALRRFEAEQRKTQSSVNDWNGLFMTLFLIALAAWGIWGPA